MLISEEYRALNRQLHEQVAVYGAFPKKERYAHIRELVKPHESILDYGCGKGLMSQAIDNVTNYDPATFPGLPSAHDVVVCMDVMEHVEPDLLGNVLGHIAMLTKRLAYFVICKSLSKKLLPDGSNTHRIVKPSHWWVGVLSRYFGRVEEITTSADGRHDMVFLCYP